MIAVLVTGAGGRMGGHVLRALEGTAGMRAAAALERPGHPDLGREISPGVKLSAELEPDDALSLARRIPVQAGRLEPEARDLGVESYVHLLM